MGCGGSYSSNDPTIVAVSPMMYAAWPCGTGLTICGPGGCIDAVRSDACPGCGATQIDLSEEGSARVCGEVGNCPVTIEETP